MIYLIKTELRTCAAFKVGFTAHNDDGRFIPYHTHNPNAELVSMMETYAKTKRVLENAIHSELRDMGFAIKHGRGTKGASDWFMVDYESDLYNRLNTEGLLVFKACKGRKELVG